MPHACLFASLSLLCLGTQCNYSSVHRHRHKRCLYMLPVGALSSSFGDGGKLPSPYSVMTLVAFPTLYSSALSSVHPCWFARWALEGEAVTSPQRANVRMPDAGLMIGKGRYTFNHLCEEVSPHARSGRRQPSPLCNPSDGGSRGGAKGSEAQKWERVA